MWTSHVNDSQSSGRKIGVGLFVSASGELLRLLPSWPTSESVSFGLAIPAQIFNCTNLVIGRLGVRGGRGVCRVPLPLIGNTFKVTEIDTPTIPL